MIISMARPWKHPKTDACAIAPACPPTFSVSVRKAVQSTIYGVRFGCGHTIYYGSRGFSDGRSSGPLERRSPLRSPARTRPSASRPPSRSRFGSRTSRTPAVAMRPRRRGVSNAGSPGAMVRSISPTSGMCPMQGLRRSLRRRVGDVRGGTAPPRPPLACLPGSPPLRLSALTDTALSAPPASGGPAAPL